LTAQLRHALAGDLAADVTLTTGGSKAQRLAFPGLGRAKIVGYDWSAETVVNWTPPGRLRALGGISRTHLHLDQVIDLSQLSGIGRFEDGQDSFGLFGELNWTVAPGATFTAGLRYQQDRQKRSGALATSTQGIPLAFDRTFQAWLPKLSFAYDFDANVRAGLLVARAYNPGGTTLRFDTGRPDNFEAETLWDYEAFVRARLAAGVDLSANLFYYDMHNAQRLKPITIQAPAGFGVTFADLFNAPRARTLGAETELQWRVSNRMSARFSAGLLRTKLVDAGPSYPEFSGKEFARSPHLSVAGAADWQATRRLRLSATARYHGPFFSDDVNGPADHIDAATIVGARAAYRIGKVTLFAYARNMFNKFALVDRTGDVSASAEDPRMVAIGIDAAF
jgi:outer membrane receptor protein involved in Fe transport